MSNPYEHPVSRPRRFSRDEGAISAVEFACLAPVFLALVYGVFEIGMFYFAQAGLTYAVKSAARQIMIGTVANTPGISATAFRTNFVCAALPPGLDCNSVVVDVEVAAYSGYYGCCFPGTPPLDNSATQFCIGSPGTYGNPGSVVVVQAFYALPVPKFDFLPLPYQTYQGGNVIAPGAISTLVNEPFTTSYQGC